MKMVILGIGVKCLNNENKNGFYVYGLVNKITNKYYIGSSVDKLGIKKRIRRHIYDLNNGTHHSVKLQRSFDKYNKDFNNWEFVILESIDRNNHIERENHYIEIYNSYNNGYNSTKSAGKIHFGEMCIKHKMAISKGKQKMKYYDLIDIFNKYNDGMNYVEISKYYDVSYVTISTIINNPKYYTDIKTEYNLSKKYYKYIFYNLKLNKLYKVNNFNEFCKQYEINKELMMALFCGNLKKTFINEWTVFSKDYFNINELRKRIELNKPKEFILYKDGIKYTFTHVVTFCKENKLSDLHIYNVLKGVKSEYKGFTINP